MNKKKSVSIIFSFRNEEECLEELIKRVGRSIDTELYDYELIFVNDASTDRSLYLLKSFAETDNRIKIVNLSRRFGYNQGFQAGIAFSSGDAVITLDADLQDPPEKIPDLLNKWREGADVVHTVRLLRKGEPPLKVWLTKAMYRAISAVSNIELPDNAGNFKLFSRRVANVVLTLKEKDPYLRGLVAWAGFRQERLYYEREERYAGKTHFPLFLSTGPIKELFSGITSFSIAPLFFLLLLGGGLAAGSFLGLIVWIYMKIKGYDVTVSVLTLLIVIFLAGIQLSGFGIVGLYIGRIWNEVSRRPNYIVESVINLERKQQIIDFNT